MPVRAQPQPLPAPVSRARPALPRQSPVPAERTIRLGQSVQGVPLTLTIFGHGSPSALIMGGIHGDEPNSAELAERLIRYLRDNPSAYAGRTIGILPAANPDGLAFHRRTNANSVDLNRNFPARNWHAARHTRTSHGDRPVSEPETRAILEAMDRINPDCIVSIHAISRGRQCNNYDGPAHAIAAMMSRLNGYPVVPSLGYATPGSFGSWAGVDRGIPTITLELPKGESGARGWEVNRDALLAVIQSGNTALPTAR